MGTDNVCVSQWMNPDVYISPGYTCTGERWTGNVQCVAYRAADDAAEGVPRALVKPVPEVVHAVLDKVLGGAEVEPVRTSGMRYSLITMVHTRGRTRG